MDKLILNTKYENNSEEECEAYFVEMNSIPIDDAHENDILNTINALGQQITKYNPCWKSRDCEMLIQSMDRIKEMTEGKSSVAIQDGMKALIRLSLQCGWTAAKGELVDSMAKCLSNDYFENLTQNQLKDHLSLFDTTLLTISELEEEDNHDFVREKQKEFSLYMFADNIKDSVFDSNLEIYQSFSRSLYFKAWAEKEPETDIYSAILDQTQTYFKQLYLKFPENLSKMLCDITEKLIQDDIPTKEGKEMICQFYSSIGPVLNNEDMEMIMDKWAKALFDLATLKREWLKPILQDLSTEIYNVDDKFKAMAFKNCGYLVKDALNYLEDLVDSFPKQSNDDDIPYEDRVSKACEFIKPITNTFLQFTMKTPEHFELFIPVLAKLISINTNESIEIFKNSFEHIEKPMQEFFKNNPHQFTKLIDSCVTTAQEAAQTEDSTTPFPFNLPTFEYGYIYERIIKFGKLSKVFNSPVVQENLRINFLKIFNRYSLTISIFMSEFNSFLIFKDYTADQMLEFLQGISTMLTNELFALYNPNSISTGNLLKSIAEHINQSGTKYSTSIPEIIKICKICMKGGLQWENYDGELSANTYSIILLFIFMQMLITKSKGSSAEEFYSLLFETINMSDESHDYYSAWVSFVAGVPRQCSTPEILVNGIPNIINLIEKLDGTSLDSNIYMLLDGLHLIIVSKPSAALNYLKEIESFLSFSNSGTNFLPIIQILTLVYGEFPEKVNEDVVTILGNKITEDTTNAYHIGNFFHTISKTHSHLLKPLLNQFVESLESSKLTLVTPFIGIVTNILEKDLHFGETIFPIFVTLIENNKEENTFCILLFTGLRSLGLLRHDLLVNLKSNVESWQKSNPAFHDTCQHLLDVIADRSLAQLDLEINEQGKVIGKIDNQLEDQKEQVTNISKEVKQQKENIDEVNQRVDDTVDRVGGLEIEVGELGEQVQVIDLKSVSSAPKWAREVSKLLNPESNEDWRLLGARLGYSVDDIRAWSTHADPCMSLLSDWFAVRRKVEATRAVLEQLVEMNRNDAAQIVENALIVAESMVSDDDPIEFITPPAIFLSYQWAVQEEVKVLREHLQKAGFRCWMDIGQMGGGDKLYEAIDRGIRGATVFISCVTKKYSESSNCKRELNLSIGLQKPVIPLQMERMDWPPVGTMGPLLTEYIFIRMFCKPGQAPVPGTFWPKDRFQELLMQIRYSCAPEYDIIDWDYANWWQPPEVKSEYRPKDQNNSTDIINKSLENGNTVGENPQIFISYQWGKQEEIKKLYNTLIKFGYSCWMDIYQMGGGDSLYDKIDRGLRGCKLMISCVTPKYGESPNCRREVSLCDSLKKPILPIMLERMTWPPEGPMSMILTQLLYISFVDTPEEQQSWTGKATKDLLNKIGQIIPSSQNVVPKMRSDVSMPAKISEEDDNTFEIINPIIEPLEESQNTENKKAILISSTSNTNAYKLPFVTSKSCIII